MELYEAGRAQSPTAEPRSRPIRETDHDRACERIVRSLSPHDRLIRSDRGRDSGRLVWTASDEWPRRLCQCSEASASDLGPVTSELWRAEAA